MVLVWLRYKLAMKIGGIIMQSFKICVLAGSLGIAMAGVGLSGCSYMNAKEARETGRTSNQVVNDKYTSERVESALARQPVYKYPAIRVQTFNGVVQLSGFVNTEEQKRSAAEIAQNVPGVQRVLNNIAVEAPMPTGRGAAGNAQQYYQGQGSEVSTNPQAPIYNPGQEANPQPGNTSTNNYQR